MRNLHKEFENKTINYEKLLEYGFCKQNNRFVFKMNIYNNQFQVIVELNGKHQISRVIDLTADEEYVLVDVKNSSGNFVGKVKEEYESILQDILEKCTEPNVFKSKQAKEVIRYIKEQYHDELEYLWKNSPKNAIWRNQTNGKWYGLLVVLPEEKLGIESDKIVDIIDLRYPSNKIKDFIDNQKIFGGYHMNKNHWITIKLDESVDIKEIYKLIDDSYQLSLEK